MVKQFSALVLIGLLTGCVNTSSSNNADLINEVSQQISASEQRISANIAEACPIQKETLPLPAKESSASCPEVKSHGKLLLGEIERVRFPKEKFVYRARVDTGADTSSLNAQNLTVFERDGEKWYRFQLAEGKDAKKLEYPLKKYVRVIQQSAKNAQRRPVVEVTVEIGGKPYTTEFTLADRSHLTYKVLLGRSFLDGVGIVDVSQSYLTSKEGK